MNIQPEFILAIITIAGNILLALFQFRQTKANAKKTETESNVLLLDKALAMNKQEIENFRIINQDLMKHIETEKLETERLKKELEIKDALIKQQEKEISELKNIVRDSYT